MNQGKPVFFDERQRRWWLTRRALELTGLGLTVLVVVFFFSIARLPTPAEFEKGNKGSYELLFAYDFSFRQTGPNRSAP